MSTPPTSLPASAHKQGTDTGFARPTRTYYDLLLAATCVVFILSNIGATKGVTFGSIITDGGFFLF